nr:5301_t:CDS:2 [Entrophospora candida]
MSLKLTAFRLLSPTIGGIRGFSQRTFFAFRMNQFVNLQINNTQQTDPFILQPESNTQYNFNTYKVVKDLEGQGLTRGQANSIMRCMEAVLINSLKIRSELLSKVELENETYHYKAELTDFRIELEVSRKKNQTALMAEIASIQRDNKMAIAIQEVNNKFIIASGDIRTRIEAVKWEMTRLVFMGVFGISVVGLFIWFFLSNRKSTKNSASSSSTSATTTTDNENFKL